MDVRNVTSTNSIISFLLYSVSNQCLPSLTALLLRRTSLPRKECRKFLVSLPIPWATVLAGTSEANTGQRHYTKFRNGPLPKRNFQLC